jgi:hypothetical protein
MHDQDLRDMQSAGRNFALNPSSPGLAYAAEMMAASVDDEEKRMLRAWFFEGVRNNARDQRHVDQIMEIIDTRVDKLLLSIGEADVQPK